MTGDSMTNFYLCVLVLIALVLYGGYEGTINIFTYGDLKIRYYIVLRKLHGIRNKYAKDLGMNKVSFKQFVHEYETSKRL